MDIKLSFFSWLLFLVIADLNFSEHVMTLMRDMERLQMKPVPEVKQQLTEKVSYYYGQKLFDDKDMRIAVEVIRMLAQDAELKIRQTLANNLKQCDALPHDVAMRLARDVSDVAVPLLEYSVVLTQEDLIEIVKSCTDLQSLIAIAKRSDIKSPLANTLIHVQEDQVTQTLLQNEKAELNEDSFRYILNLFPDNDGIMQLMVNHANLPVGVAERILSHVSSDLQETLMKRFHIDRNVARQLTEATKEQTTLFVLSNGSKIQQTESLVAHLFTHNKLTHSIILRALCKGDLPFFEVAMAKLAGITPQLSHELIWKQGVSGFSSLYKRAGLPKGTFNAVNIILQFAIQEINEGSVGDEHYAKRMIDRITDAGYDKKISIMEYFLVLMKSKVNAVDVVQLQ
jgi:uncharacterized protein (DUF2336 family)